MHRTRILHASRIFPFGNRPDPEKKHNQYFIQERFYRMYGIATLLYFRVQPYVSRQF